MRSLYIVPSVAKRSTDHMRLEYLPFPVDKC